MEPRSCDEVRPHLEAWMDDDDLPAAAREAVERHVASCDDCEQDLEDLRRIGDLVRYVVRAPRAPDTLRARVVAEVRRQASLVPAAAVGPRVGPGRRRWALAAAGLVIALTGGALTYSILGVPRPPSGTTVAAEAVQRHVAALMADRLIEVASTDQHTVKPWFDGRVDFSPAVPRLDSLGFYLEGGRVDRVAGRTVAALVYRRRLHVIDVFTWPVASRPTGRATADPPSYDERGYHALHWVHDGMEFWAVSDVALADLTSFVDAFTRAAGSDGGESSAGHGEPIRGNRPSRFS